MKSDQANSSLAAERDGVLEDTARRSVESVEAVESVERDSSLEHEPRSTRISSSTTKRRFHLLVENLCEVFDRTQFFFFYS